MVKRTAGGNGKFVAYYRVSTDKQGKSGLGLEAQQEAARSYLAGKGWPPVAELVEVETGKTSARPKLAEALNLCRLHNATLLIAKLDRLARNVHFVSGLMESGVPFVAADRPNATPFEIHIYAAMSEEEARAVSVRTKAALAAYKARVEAGMDKEGKKLRPLGTPANLKNGDLGRERASASRSRKAKGHAADLAPVIRDLQADGATTLRDLAEALNVRGIPAARGGEWSATQVQRVLSRLGRSHNDGRPPVGMEAR